MTWTEALNQLADCMHTLAVDYGLKASVDTELRPEPGEIYANISTYNQMVHLYLEPAEFAGESIPATVWFYSYPFMRRVRLVGPNDKGDWEIQSSDGISFHKFLNKETFRELVGDLSRYAA